ncbi:MAG: acyl-CoA dehydrogenase family protein [Trueperaceae bacterium]|nr:MAG: acyl-CoA dehydrogenase family protein [Trueperaceae bacterium]
MAVTDKRSTAPQGGSFLIERHRAESILIPEAFSDELKMMGQAAEQYVEREIKPDFEALEALDYELSVQKIRKAGDQGLLGIDVPEAYGGLDIEKTASMLVTEKLAQAGSFNVTFNAHSGIGTLPLVYFGTPEQQAKYLPGLVSGEKIAAYCLSEPGSGSDALGAKTRALLNDAGTHYLLSGTKMWISNAGFADLFTVFAKVDGEHFSAFLVERDTPGLSLGAEEKKMGIKGSSTRPLILENAEVPKENLLGELGRGHVIAFQILNLGRLKLAAGAIGGCKEMVRLASGYAQERQQFGKAIAEFGLIQEKIGKMSAETFALESAIYRLTGAMDEHLAGALTQAEKLAAIGEYVVEYSLLKVAGSEILDRTIDEALQVYGGYGFSAEYPIELAYRNSRINRIFEGTNEINRLLTSGQLLKRAMKGQLELMGAAQAAIQGEPVTDVSAPEPLVDAFVAVENMKRAALLVAGLGAGRYMQALEQEQELMARVADMVAGIYLAESALLRSERLLGSNRGEISNLLAKIVTFEAFDQARVLGSEALRRIGNRDGLAKLESYLSDHGVDLIALRRKAAESSYQQGGYPL